MYNSDYFLFLASSCSWMCLSVAAEAKKTGAFLLKTTFRKNPLVSSWGVHTSEENQPSMG